MTAAAPPRLRSSPRPRRVGLVSLGCAKNLVDAEIMLGSLLKDGVEIVNDPAEADALIVNTCSFIDAAQQESVDAILESAEFRSQHRPGQAVIVSGCLPQRFRDELPRLLPEVDAFMGIDQVEHVGRIIEDAIAARAGRNSCPPAGRPSPSDLRRNATRHAVGARLAELDHPPIKHVPVPPIPVTVHARPNYIPHWDTPRYRLTPRHFAYLKIAEGCNHPCSFCIIPRMRGGHRSRAQADIVAEARRLIDDGVRELNLISQDSTYYGLDLRANPSRAIASPERFSATTRALPAESTTLGSLLRALNDLPGDFWIRLLYTHPAHWTDDLIATIAACPKVARYVDMPLQHIHDDLLARMRRETSGAYIRGLIARIRAGIPGITLRTTFIVGFPGETKEHFESLVEFIRTTRFERLGVFTYSQEEGTVAGKMRGQVPAKVRQQRRDRAMAAQHAIASDLSAGCVGREFKVLIEGSADDDQLRRANVFSWEHGLIRESAQHTLGSPELENPTDTRSFVVARSEADAPDIDGRIYIRGRLPAGEFAQVRIIGHTDYDLIGEAL